MPSIGFLHLGFFFKILLLFSNRGPDDKFPFAISLYFCSFISLVHSLWIFAFLRLDRISARKDRKWLNMESPFFQYQEKNDKLLCDLLEKVTFPLVVIIDGVDNLQSTESLWIDWIPTELQSNIRLILTVTSGSDVYNELMVSLILSLILTVT